ncbi:preprotein translocase subunit SecG [uncultured Desulfobulbus sp.]|uniref:preprotein translocase subunit SecG n=1 Tax=uncultured Desulfobulbus sp. TaxID=239745 RepID=UPI0029C957AD|nr:preprotein translocase subunit SecG [uncultured Desulfobulbus sp.]
MITLIIVAHTIVCLFLICIVLLQHGKGADVGASFGGSSQSLFGAEGPMPLLNKITTLAAIVFMGTSITLAYLSAHKSSGSVMSDVKVQEQQAPTQQPPVAVPMPTSPVPEKEIPKGTKEKSSPQ